MKVKTGAGSGAAVARVGAVVREGVEVVERAPPSSHRRALNRNGTSVVEAGLHLHSKSHLFSHPHDPTHDMWQQFGEFWK